MKIIHKIIHKKKYYSIAEKNDYSIYFRPLTVIFKKNIFLIIIVKYILLQF